MSNEMPDLLTAKQAAEYLQISQRTLYSLTQAGTIGCVRLSKKLLRYRRIELEKLGQGPDQK